MKKSYKFVIEGEVSDFFHKPTKESLRVRLMTLYRDGVSVKIKRIDID